MAHELEQAYSFRHQHPGIGPAFLLDCFPRTHAFHRDEMKHLIILLCLTQTLASAGEWYEGYWIYDSGLTQQHNPKLSSGGLEKARAGFDKWGGKIEVTPRRVKGKRFKLGIPYRVVSEGNETLTVEMKGLAVEIAKTFTPKLRQQSLLCEVVQINHNVISFEIPALKTIHMVLRRVE